MCLALAVGKENGLKRQVNCLCQLELRQNQHGFAFNRNNHDNRSLHQVEMQTRQVSQAWTGVYNSAFHP